MSDLCDLIGHGPADMGADPVPKSDCLVCEIERLTAKIDDPSWLDFMEICDNFLTHYPPDIFTGVSGDPGPLFVVALRKAKEALAATEQGESDE